jgi:hypothetical protein
LSLRIHKKHDTHLLGATLGLGIRTIYMYTLWNIGSIHQYALTFLLLYNQCFVWIAWITEAVVKEEFYMVGCGVFVEYHVDNSLRPEA